MDLSCLKLVCFFIFFALVVGINATNVSMSRRLKRVKRTFAIILDQNGRSVGIGFAWPSFGQKKCCCFYGGGQNPGPNPTEPSGTGPTEPTEPTVPGGTEPPVTEPPAGQINDCTECDSDTETNTDPGGGDPPPTEAPAEPPAGGARRLIRPRTSAKLIRSSRQKCTCKGFSNASALKRSKVIKRISAPAAPAFSTSSSSSQRRATQSMGNLSSNTKPPAALGTHTPRNQGRQTANTSTRIVANSSSVRYSAVNQPNSGKSARQKSTCVKYKGKVIC